MLCLHTHAIVPQRGPSTRREAHFVSTCPCHFYIHICVHGHGSERISILLIITVLLLAFIVLYMADCITFIYQCMESVQCFLVV